MYEIFDTQCQQIVANEFTNLGLSHITYPYQAEFPAMTNSGIMVFSKHKCLSRKQEIYNYKTGVENLASKGILICQFSIHNKIINLLATHLSANILDREHQLTQLGCFIKKINTQDALLIISGDLNSKPEIVKKWSDNLNLYNPKLIENSLTYTYPCKDFKFRDGLSEDKKEIIDYILLNKNIVASSTIIKLISPCKYHLKKVLINIYGYPIYNCCNWDKITDLSDHCALYTKIKY